MIKNNILDSTLFYFMERKNNENILHIKGNGDMPNFFDEEWGIASPPWIWKDKFHPDRVIVHSGVASLGKYAFRTHKNLKEIRLPNTLTYIGKHCFEDCVSLQKIQWPKSVKEIKSSTFSGCSSLTDIELSEGVEILWRWCFKNCNNLRTITIPSSIRRISTTAFWGTDLQELYERSGRYCLWKQGIYENDKLLTILHQAEIIKIREGTHTIADYACYGNENLISVHCPSSLRNIEKKAFSHCHKLKEIYMPNSVRIHEEAFKDSNQVVMNPPPKSKLTFDTGKIATTRVGYATLQNGKLQLSPEIKNIDMTKYIDIVDFVDIQGGFDYILGLRKNGSTVLIAPSNHCLARANGQGPFWNIATDEGRCAAIDTYGFLHHWSGYPKEQSPVQVPETEVRSVSVGFNHLMYIDMDGVLHISPNTDDYGYSIEENYKKLQQQIGEEFQECASYAPYYCTITSAVRTVSGRIFWTVEEHKLFEIPDTEIQTYAIGSHVFAAIRKNGTAFYCFYPTYGENSIVIKEIQLSYKAVAISIIHSEYVLVLMENGEVHRVDIKEVIHS